MKTLLVYIRIIAFFLFAIMVIPGLIITSKTKKLSLWYNKTCFKIFSFFFGMKTKIKKGKLANIKNLLLVCNHNSYLDVFGLGSLLKINFVAKGDVKKWPLFGTIASLGNTVYISRDRMKAGSQVDFMEKELEKRNNPLLVFPEGTSTDGNEVLPFKSSLFAMFEKHIGKKNDNQITIQPISIAYTHQGKKKLNNETRKTYAWYIKEQGLIEHMINAVKHSPFTMEVIIHDPIDLSTFKDRKELAKYCHDIVEKGFNELIEK